MLRLSTRSWKLQCRMNDAKTPAETSLKSKRNRVQTLPLATCTLGIPTIKQQV
jgi:hypothetical protein